MNHRPVRLLVIDDNTAYHRLLTEAFRQLTDKREWDLTFLDDGEKALDLLVDEKTPWPDLILLDWNLSRMNGDAVLKRLKADDPWKQIPVLVLSTSDAKANIETAYDYHANGFITKPSDLDRLYRMVDAIVEFWTTIVQLPTFTTFLPGPSRPE